jgi:hypothetical protein
VAAIAGRNRKSSGTATHERRDEQDRRAASVSG